MAEPQFLDITEQQTISEALIRLISSWENLPTDENDSSISPEWQYLSDNESIGVYAMQGAVYLQKYLSGAFNAQFPFMIRYCVNASNSRARIDSQKVLDDLGEWLEKTAFPQLTDNRTINSIERTSTSFLFSRTESGNEIYQCNMMLKYTKNGG